jgi:predicted small lipoprotein YifL
MNTRIFIMLLLSTLAFTLAGCATNIGPLEVDTSDEGAQSFDGLYPATGARRGTKVWMQEDLDLSAYNKIMLQGAGISYRPVKSASSVAAVNSNRQEFPIAANTRDDIRDTFSASFVKELGKQDRFEVVEEPGPGVLLVRGALLDVISRVPPEPIGRSNIYLSTVGEATLIVELRDSESEAPLLRAMERRATTRNTDMPIWSNPVTNMNEVRILADAWARRVSASLIYLSDTYGIGDES